MRCCCLVELVLTDKVKNEFRTLAFSEGSDALVVRLGGVLLCLGFSLWYEDQKSRGEAISEAS